jgi:ABC-type uncharacterized transport system permease subunit
MEVIIGISGATTAASLLVALFKLGVPSASSALIALVAFLAGQASAVLVTAAQGGLATEQKVIASILLTGIMAAAAAAGISRTDNAAEAKRIGADVQANREVIANLGAKAEKEANK